METNTPERDRRQVVHSWLDEELRNYYGGVGRLDLLLELQREYMTQATDLFAAGKDEEAVAKRALSLEFKQRYDTGHKRWREALQPGDRVQLKRALDRLREIDMLIEEDDTPDGPRDTER